MKSLERRYNGIEEQNPYWSSYICFAEAVKGQGFSKSAIAKWFNVLVEKKEYSRYQKQSLVIGLVEQTKKA